MPALHTLEWDSAHFGFDIAKLELDKGESEQKVRALLGRTRAECIISRVPTSDLQGAWVLEESGFELMDILIRLDLGVSAFIRGPSRSGCQVRDYRQSDIASLREIARTSFTTGHFRSDKRFDQKKVDELYSLWVKKCVERQFEFSVAVSDGEPVGFVAARDEGAKSVIELVAVDSATRSRGVGNDLMSCYLETAKQRHGKVEIGVHLDNIPALRLYERLGFAVSQGELTFHRWNDS